MQAREVDDPRGRRDQRLRARARAQDRSTWSNSPSTRTVALAVARGLDLHLDVAWPCHERECRRRCSVQADMTDRISPFPRGRRMQVSRPSSSAGSAAASSCVRANGRSPARSAQCARGARGRRGDGRGGSGGGARVRLRRPARRGERISIRRSREFSILSSTPSSPCAATVASGSCAATER